MAEGSENPLDQIDHFYLVRSPNRLARKEMEDAVRTAGVPDNRIVPEQRISMFTDGREVATVLGRKILDENASGQERRHMVLFHDAADTENGIRDSGFENLVQRCWKVALAHVPVGLDNTQRRFLETAIQHILARIRETRDRVPADLGQVVHAAAAEATPLAAMLQALPGGVIETVRQRVMLVGIGGTVSSRYAQEVAKDTRLTAGAMDFATFSIVSDTACNYLQQVVVEVLRGAPGRR